MLGKEKGWVDHVRHWGVGTCLCVCLYMGGGGDDSSVVM